MPAKIVAGKTEVSRRDYFFIDANEIVVKEELRGRSTPPTEEAILDMAISLHDYGQQQPVKCRKMADHRLLLAMGFTRCAAARVLNVGFEKDGKHYHDPNFRLQTTLTDGDDAEAFVANVVENAHRNQTSPIDDAVNQRTLREKYGKSDVEIAKLYQYGSAGLQKVARLRQLLSLPENIRNLIHRGIMGVQAGIDLLSIVDETERNAAYEKCLTDAETNGKVNGAEIKDHIRALVNDDHVEGAPENPERNSEESGASGSSGGTTPRAPAVGASMRNFGKLAEALRDLVNDKIPAAKLEKINNLGEVMLLWKKGTRNQAYLVKTIIELATK
jgi:hypothetical protein